jgi:hypothetical protein
VFDPAHPDGPYLVFSPSLLTAQGLFQRGPCRATFVPYDIDYVG